MKLSDIRDHLQCAVLTGADKLDTEVNVAVASDGMSAVLAAPHPGALLITALTNIQSVRTADVAYMAAVLYVRGHRPNGATIEFAGRKGIVLLATSLGMFDACGILRERGLCGAS